MAQTIRVPLEDTSVEVAIPSGWRVLGEHMPQAAIGLDDVPAALRAALAQPIGVAPMEPDALAGRSIAIVVDDISRPTPVHRYFAALIEFLESRGARRESMRIVMALGVHRPMTHPEVDEKLGAGQYAGIRWFNHDARDPSATVPLGTTSRGTPVALNRHLTEVDLVVCVGAIEPHLLLGFGGGLKMLVPGLASQDTIARNHMQGVTPTHFNFVGEATSPMRLDLEEAAQMLRKPIFVVNVVMNERLEPCSFVCGDPIAAHRAGVERVRAIARCAVPAPADVVIVASNPMNADLRQGMKSVGHVQSSVKEGGLVIALLGCRFGIGDIRVPARTLPHGVLRGVLRVIGRHRVLGFVDRVQRGAGVEERFLAHFSLQTTRRNELFVWSPRLPADTGRRLGVFAQFASVEAMMARAAEVAPRDATVHVFPHGGMTYAALPT